MMAYFRIIGKFEGTVQSQFVIAWPHIHRKATALSDIEGELQTAPSAIADSDSVVELQSGASDLFFNLCESLLHPAQLSRADALRPAHRIVFN
jgi:hypothetical protein